MGADRWSVCKPCDEETKRRRNDALTEAHAQYGKVTANEFVRTLRAAEGLPDQKIEHTLREDYEFYLSDGLLQISYRSNCTECDFTFNYEQEVDTHG